MSVAIKVEGLSKSYKIGEKTAYSYRSFRDVLANAFKFKKNKSPKPEFWALKDVSFEVEQGEVVGIIGRNGAGKSTLLKILSRITEPTEGYAEIHGRVGSLLEVGTGFHPELTGRENIYLNGSILGMKRREIAKKFDEIVDFAEVEKFIDTPVKHYSSGMYVRLAFAVAAHLEPEILVVDEVLAVGDFAFQKKCLGKMESISNQGKTVLFVSHNLGTINNLCNVAFLFSQGSLIMKDSSQKVITHYMSLTHKSNGYAFKAVRNPDKPIQIITATSCNDSGKPIEQFDINSPVNIQIEYSINKKLTGAALTVQVIKEGIILSTSFDTDENDFLLEARNPGEYVCKVVIKAKSLKPGFYTINIGAGILNQQRIDFIENAISFDIMANTISDTHKGFSTRRDGLVILPITWSHPLPKALM